MNPTSQFLAYAAAFEKSFVDDDWSRLEDHFTEDAVYEVTGGAPLGGRWEGRPAVLVHLRESVVELDQRFDSRKTEILGAPTVDEGSIEFEWRGTYELDGRPALVFGGIERAEYEGDRIRLLVDTMNEGDDQVIQAFMAAHLGVDLGTS